MIKVEPSKQVIVFGIDSKKTYFRVSNESGERVEFKIKITNPMAYVFKPCVVGELEAY